MKVFLLPFLIVLLGFQSYAQPQSPGGLPQLLPPTPDASQLIKVGLGNINQSTGAAQAAIPLYKIKIKEVEVPIALNYLSQGNKVEELCSRVGFGWSLQAGGVIVRKVMGTPDESSPRLASVTNADLSSGTSQAIYNYLNNGKTTNGTTDPFDTQPDEFYYSFNGHSGKFVFNDDFRPEVISHENLKIAMGLTSSHPGPGVDIAFITITTPDGVKYSFGTGNAYDKTKSDGYYKGDVFPKTSFYLSSITSPTNDIISFAYSRVDTRTLTGFSETVSTPGQGDESSGNACPQGHFIESRSLSFQSITNDACYLSEISTSTGVFADFFYEPMPDQSDDVRMKSVTVRNSNDITVCQYSFSYVDCQGVLNAYPTSPNTSAAGLNGRFFLTRVYQPFVTPQDAVEPIGYQFDYYDGERSSFKNLDGVYAQDYFGFANGRNNQSLLPKPAAPDDFSTSMPWADKTPDPDFAIKGMLKKITYPTGGSEEFFYEPNTVATMEVIPIQGRVTRNIHGIGTNDYGPANISSTYTDYFNVYTSNVGSFSLSQSVENSCNPPCGLCKTVYCTLTDITNGGSGVGVKNYVATSLYSISDPVALTAGHKYKLETRISGPACFHVQLVLNYDASHPELQPVNHITGGVRVSRIGRNDPLTGNAANKYFYYASVVDLTRSSGRGLLKQFYQTSIKSIQGCQGLVCDYCVHNIYSSNGVYNLFATNNSHVYYTDIIEADDPDLANGGTQYVFYNPVFSGGTTRLRGTDIPYPPDNVNANFNGILKSTIWFDAQQRPVRSEANDYETVSSDNIVRSVCIRKEFTYSSGVTAPDPIAFKPFDVRESDYSPFWLRLASKTTTEYSNGTAGLQTTVRYTYGSNDNVLPREEKTSTSKNEETKITRTYANDNPFAEPAVATMKSKYQIAALIQEINSVNGNNIAEKRIKYKDWYNDGKVLVPEIIKIQQNASSNMEDRITFSSYDSKGNVTEVGKTGGQHTVYIWDHKQALVTAEVKNAAPDQVAYTSFEADGKGNWSTSGTVLFDAHAPTGKNVFSGSVTKSALIVSKTYIVSCWAQSRPSVTGATLKLTGRSVDGYTYYEYRTNAGITSVTVSGGGKIDELRLYPSDAQMISYTYEPLIGVTSQCDVNNRISYYEYDNLKRLRMVRDQDKYIIKAICYNYTGQVENCGTVAPFYSQAKTGYFTRKTCSTGQTGQAYAYTVPFGAYTSSAGQAAADQLATNDVNANGQTQANLHGECLTNGTSYLKLTNVFSGTDPFPVIKLEFLRGNTVAYTFSFPSSRNGSVTVSVPAGVYRLRLKKPAGYADYTLSYQAETTFVDASDGTEYETGDIEFSINTAGEALEITASNSL